jgi:hypothetical protein
MIMRLLAVLAVAACLGACNAEQSAPPAATDTPEATAPADPNTLTAEGWGPLRIGMTREEVVAALGPDANPDAVGGPDPEQCDEFRPERAPEGMLVMIEQGMLTRISVGEGSALKTDRGFGVGDTAAAIKAAYGASAAATPHKYAAPPAEYITVWSNRTPSAEYVQDSAARGIVYETGDDGVVDHVFIGGPSIQYVEGCA